MKCERCGEVNPAEIHTCTPQEPVAWMYEFGTDNGDAVNEIRWYPNVHWKKPTGLVRNVVPLYTAPPQREEGCAECAKKSSDGWALYCVQCIEPPRTWAGLTDEEMREIWDKSGWYVTLFKAVEAKLKEKNT